MIEDIEPKRARLVRWYWLSFRRGVHVTYHLFGYWTVLWRGVYGVQIAGVFIGVVRSFDIPEGEGKDPADVLKPFGTWAPDDIRRVFVEGAKWWEWQKAQATMWPDDVSRAEHEASRRYTPEIKS